MPQQPIDFRLGNAVGKRTGSKSLPQVPHFHPSNGCPLAEMTGKGVLVPVTPQEINHSDLPVDAPPPVEIRVGGNRLFADKEQIPRPGLNPKFSFQFPQSGRNPLVACWNVPGTGCIVATGKRNRKATSFPDQHLKAASSGPAFADEPHMDGTMPEACPVRLLRIHDLPRGIPEPVHDIDHPARWPPPDRFPRVVLFHASRTHLPPFSSHLHHFRPTPPASAMNHPPVSMPLGSWEARNPSSPMTSSRSIRYSGPGSK